MKLILQAIKSLLNKINSRLEALENKTSDENIADGKFLPDGTPFIASFPFSFFERVPFTSSAVGSEGTIYNYDGYSALNLTVGNTYTVSYNGKEYECECKTGRNYQTIGCYLGNGEFFDGESSSEPFAVFVPDEPRGRATYYVSTKEEMEAVELSITGENEYIRKLEERLLPPVAYPLVIDVSLDAVGNGTIESGHTYDDIHYAFETEKRDIVIRNKTTTEASATKVGIYRLSNVLANYYYFTYTEITSSYVLLHELGWDYNNRISVKVSYLTPSTSA